MYTSYQSIQSSLIAPALLAVPYPQRCPHFSSNSVAPCSPPSAPRSLPQPSSGGWRFDISGGHWPWPRSQRTAALSPRHAASVGRRKRGYSVFGVVGGTTQRKWVYSAFRTSMLLFFYSKHIRTYQLYTLSMVCSVGCMIGSSGWVV